MTKFETSVLDAQYYVHTVLVADRFTHEVKQFSMYSTFQSAPELQALLGSVNSSVLVTIRNTAPCPREYQKSSACKHYSLNQMFAILSTIRFVSIETRKRYKLIEVTDTVEVDVVGEERLLGRLEDCNVYDSWDKFEEAIVDMMIQKEGEK